jgi:AmpD protein
MRVVRHLWRTQHEDDRLAPPSAFPAHARARVPLRRQHHAGLLGMFSRGNGPSGSDEILDSQGWVKHVRHLPSPNCDPRPEGTRIRLIVIHNISLPPGVFDGDAVIELFTNRLDWDTHPYYQNIRGLRVSAHFFVRRDGETIQFVPCALRAWHAGASIWKGHERCNDFSIGIELEGTDDLPFTEAQYDALNPLLRTLRQAYPIEAVTGHADIAPGRKTDPGPHFDWQRLQA